MIIILIFMAFALSTLFTWYFASAKATLYLVDAPNHRSLHATPIPLTGGLAMLLALSITLIASYLFLPNFLTLSFWQSVYWIISSSLLIALISFIDDCRPISALHRLLIHSLAAILLLSQTNLWLSVLILPGLVYNLPFPISFILSTLFIVWMVNLYNFMDGMDGFAGGMSSFGFSGLAILGFYHGHLEFAFISLLVVAVSVGFLIFNFPPARIFMGDTGASTLGFLAAALSLWGQSLHIFPLWMIILLFSPFIVDATVTLLRRLMQKEKIWQAHKTHYYQQLVQLGWGHRKTVLWEYRLMTACLFSTMISRFLPVYGQWLMIIGWLAIYGFLMRYIHYLQKSKQIN